MSKTASRLQILLLALVLLLAMGLRMYNLSGESLSLDEGQSYAPVAMPFGEMLNEIKQDTHPPLYFVLLYGSIRIFGDTEFGMRIPSVLFGVLAVLLVFPVTRLLRDRETALIATVLAAASLFQIRHAQEARMYSLTACLSLLSCWCFLRLYKKHDSPIDVIAYVLSTTLLLYTHFYGLFILAAQNLYALMIIARVPDRSPFRFWKWVGLQTLITLLFLPWLGILLSQIDRVQSGFWIPQVGPMALIRTFEHYAGTSQAYWLSVGLLVLLLIVKLRSSKRTTERVEMPDIDSFSFLLLWLFTPLVIPLILSQFSQPIYVIRYTIGASFAWYILVACGIAALPRLWLRMGVLTVLVITASQALPRFYNTNVNPDWRTLAAYVDSNATNSDLVLFHKFNLERPFNFYSKRDDLEKRPGSPQGGRFYSGEQQRDVARVKALVNGYDRVWLVLGYTSATAMSSKELRSILSDMYTLKHDERYRHIGLLLYEKKN